MNLKVPFPGVAVIDGVFTKEFCDELIHRAETANKWERSRVITKGSCENGYQASMVSNHRTCSQVLLTKLDVDMTPELIAGTNKAFELYNDQVYIVPADLRFQQPYICRYLEGQHFGRHSDEIYLGVDQFRVYTATLYLNESMGGDLWFPKQGFAVENITGRLVIFPSMAMYEHQSNIITKGVKYSVPMWKMATRRIPLSELYEGREEARSRDIRSRDPDSAARV